MASAVAVVAVAALFPVLYGAGYVGYDAMASLAWGQQLAAFDRPSFDLGPTPHPLSNAVAALFSVLDRPDTALVLVAYLAFGAVAVATFHIGRHLAGAWAGVVAAVLVATRAAIVGGTGIAVLDVPYAALVLAAIAVGLRAGRPSAGVFALLGVAGLLRPEAWFLAGFAWLWSLRTSSTRQAVLTAIVVAAAPAIWMAFDFAVTGNAIFSFTSTADAAAEITQFDHGFRAALVDIPKATGNTSGMAVSIAAVLGFAVLFLRDRRSALLVGATFVAVAVAVAIPVVAGTLVNPRYVMVLTGLACVLAGVALTAFLQQQPSLPIRATVAASTAAILLVTAPGYVDVLKGQRALLAQSRGSYDSVRRLLAEPRGCGPLVVPAVRLRPFVAVALDEPLDQIVLGEPSRDRAGTYLIGSPAAAKNVIVMSGRSAVVRMRPPAGSVPGPADGVWRLHANCAG